MVVCEDPWVALNTGVVRSWWVMNPACGLEVLETVLNEKTVVGGPTKLPPPPPAPDCWIIGPQYSSPPAPPPE